MKTRRLVSATLICLCFVAWRAGIVWAAEGNRPVGDLHNGTPTDDTGNEKGPATTKRPTRTILFIIDGLSWRAPERLKLRSFRRLAAQGTYVRWAHHILPYHPTTRQWLNMHTSSLPNPVMLAGTLFIRPKQKLVQDCFHPRQLTAHVANAGAYRSLNQSNAFSMMRPGTDGEAVREAMRLMAQHDIRFMRIHLQKTGSAGWRCHNAEENTPWRRNIWAEGSPYVKAARNADHQLGRFVDHLNRINKWKDTLLVVTADHGQSRTGAHPPLDRDSSITPLLFVGPGVARGRVLEYAEHTDIIPTICDLMGVNPPNVDGGTGRVLDEIKTGVKPPSKRIPQPLHQLNKILRDYMITRARLQLEGVNNPALATEVDIADNQFYSLQRFTEWPQARSLEKLIGHNQAVLKKLKALLYKPPAKGPLNTLTPQEKADGWILLFDGRTLSGWEPDSECNWQVRDGAIRVSKGKLGLLVTKREFDNYVLKVDFRSVRGANSAVYLRTPFEMTDVTTSCYELNIADFDDKLPYHHSPTGSFMLRKLCEGYHDTTDWQHFEVVADGAYFAVKLDGWRVLEYTDPKPVKTGRIGLQFNRGLLEFRNIKLKRLPSKNTNDVQER